MFRPLKSLFQSFFRICRFQFFPDKNKAADAGKAEGDQERQLAEAAQKAGELLEKLQESGDLSQMSREDLEAAQKALEELTVSQAFPVF